MSEPSSTPHRRRPRYAGKNPRRFEEKYKELAPEKYPETIAKVMASGKTPAGMHRPILVREILEVLHPMPGELVIDCTLGYGGHTGEILPLIQPGGRLIGLDVDPIEQPRTEARLRDRGFGPEVFTARRSNFAGLPRVLNDEGLSGADCIIADLGVSSMQLDTPDRGFSVKHSGPLDMRMNPQKGRSAADFLANIDAARFSEILHEYADEPRADLLASHLAGRVLVSTVELAQAIRSALGKLPEGEQDKAIRRVFQVLRIAVNEEFTALDTLLRHLPNCLNPGGRVAILTFHSGEDRRVKKAFQSARLAGLFSKISEEVIRPSPAECGTNPRASSAKLRWARR